MLKDVFVRTVWTGWQLIPRKTTGNQGSLINGAVLNKWFDRQVGREEWSSKLLGRNIIKIIYKASGREDTAVTHAWKVQRGRWWLVVWVSIQKEIQGWISLLAWVSCSCLQAVRMNRTFSSSPRKKIRLVSVQYFPRTKISWYVNFCWEKSEVFLLLLVWPLAKEVVRAGRVETYQGCQVLEEGEFVEADYVVSLKHFASNLS